MRKGQWLALVALLGALGVIMGLTAPVHSQRPPREETLAQRLARSAGLPEDHATKLFNALGPVLREELANGKQVVIPGLGTFRVVRVPEHRDLITGPYSQPILVPAQNTVEFLPSGQLVTSSNSAAAQPAEVVPPFQYIPLPGQTPGQKTGRIRVPTIRTR
jgi:nucleoid DNA-binding protein